MSMFNDILSKTKTATQTVGKKANDLLEVTKLNLEVSDRQTQIDKTFRQIGEVVYEQYRDQGMASGNVAELCGKIEEEFANIQALREKISELKQIKNCKSCGEENPSTNVYCAKCGVKLEPYPSEMKAEEPPVDAPEDQENA